MTIGSTTHSPVSLVEMTSGQLAPGSKVSLVSGGTATAGTISFSIRTTMTGGTTVDSPTINLNVKCQAATATISSDISTFTKDVSKGDTTNNKFVFNLMTCSRATCCAAGLTYKVNDVNTLPTTGSTTFTSTTFDNTV